MSYKALSNLTNYFEIKFIKESTPEELNKYFKLLKNRIDLLEKTLFEASEQIYDNPDLEEKIQKVLD